MEDYKRANLESYNRNARVFSEYFKGLLDLERRHEFKEFVGLLKGNKILDLGCGGGDHALWFESQSLDTIGIDFSEEMIKICREKGLKAEVMDIEDLKFDDNSFDGIWAVTSLLHVPKSKINHVMDKLSRILKEEGILYVVVKEGQGEEFIIDKQNPETKRLFSFWEEKELLSTFSEKFKIINFWKEKVSSTIYLHAFFRNNK